MSVDAARQSHASERDAAVELSSWERRELGLRAAGIHDRLAEAARELRLLQARLPETSVLDDVELTIERALGAIVACRREVGDGRASAQRR